MDDTRMPKQFLYGKLKMGNYVQGGQTHCFKDILKHSLNQCNIAIDSWESSAPDRSHCEMTGMKKNLHRELKIAEVIGKNSMRSRIHGLNCAPSSYDPVAAAWVLKKTAFSF
ncbi:unnamed protein product [Caretta caretta]